MKIFTIHDRSTGKTKYYLNQTGKAERISKDRWFKIYDSGNSEVLPPLTID